MRRQGPGFSFDGFRRRPETLFVSKRPGFFLKTSAPEEKKALRTFHSTKVNTFE